MDVSVFATLRPIVGGRSVEVPLPEGASYLGFIFARAPRPEQVEAALRQAHAQLNVVIAPLWKGITSIAA